VADCTAHVLEMLRLSPCNKLHLPQDELQDYEDVIPLWVKRTSRPKVAGAPLAA
jgi:hypothetical protein